MARKPSQAINGSGCLWAIMAFGFLMVAAGVLLFLAYAASDPLQRAIFPNLAGIGVALIVVGAGITAAAWMARSTRY